MPTKLFVSIQTDRKRGDSPKYEARFAEIEPFYDGQAYGCTWQGQYVLVSETGSIIREVYTGTRAAGYGFEG